MPATAHPAWRAAYCFNNGAAAGAFPPQLVPVPGPNNQWQSLSVGAGHKCGLTLSSSVLCWGSNEYGQVRVVAASMHACLLTWAARAAATTPTTCHKITAGHAQPAPIPPPPPKPTHSCAWPAHAVRHRCKASQRGGANTHCHAGGHLIQPGADRRPLHVCPIYHWRDLLLWRIRSKQWRCAVLHVG